MAQKKQSEKKSNSIILWSNLKKYIKEFISGH